MKQASDGSNYITITNGNGNLIDMTNVIFTK